MPLLPVLVPSLTLPYDVGHSAGAVVEGMLQMRPDVFSAVEVNAQIFLDFEARQELYCRVRACMCSLLLFDESPTRDL